MPDVHQDPLPKLLIVDDESSIRTSMSMLLTEIGYSVRSAQDGFSALVEIREEITDIILSDLNMPSISGFELPSVVRRRFPSIRVTAMSGAFSGHEVPSGVNADAFYQKGSGIRSLLKIIGELAEPERLPGTQLATSAPLWIKRNGHDASGEPYVSMDARSACGPSNKLSLPLSARREKRIASIAEILFTAQSSSLATGRPDRCPKDPIARQNQLVRPQLQY